MKLINKKKWEIKKIKQEKNRIISTINFSEI